MEASANTNASLLAELDRLQAEVARFEQTQSQLTDRLEHFSTIFENSLDAFYVLKTLRAEDGRIFDFSFVEVNSRALQMLSLGRDELIGQRMCQLFPVNLTNGFFEKYVAAVESGQSFEEEFFLPEYEVWLHHQVAPLLDGILITTRNVTQQQHTAAALRASESRYRLLSEAMPQLVWSTRPDGQADYLNNRWLEYTGQTLNEAGGLGWQLAVHPDDRPRTAAVWDRAIQTGQLYQVEYRLRAKDGSYRWFLARGLPVKDEQNAITAWFGTTTDVHDQKQAEVAQRFLAEAAEVLASSLDYEATLVALARLAVSTLADYCLVDVVTEDEQIQRLAVAHADPTKEDIALQLNRFTPDRDSTSRVARVMRTGVSEVITRASENLSELVLSNQEQRAILLELGFKSCMIVPLMARGRTFGTITLVSAQAERIYNSTDLLVAEELGRRAALAVDNARLYLKAQEAARAQKELNYLKDLFMSVATHELRTPLTSIRGYAQILQRKLGQQFGSSNDEKATKAAEGNLRAVDTILRQSERMSKLIAQLLDFSRIHNGQLQLNYADGVNMVELVQSVVEQQRATTFDHTIVTCNDQPIVTATCDEARIEQVLTNLLSNAIKYSPSGSTVTIGVQIESPGQELMVIGENQIQNPTPPAASFNLPPLNEVVVWVRDEGAGIELEQQAFIFERFYRARTQANVKVEGLGLGLYISREIIQQHGGRLWLKSQPGLGSTFYFALPITHDQTNSEN